MHVTAGNQERVASRCLCDPEALRAALARISRELGAGELSTLDAERASSPTASIRRLRAVLADAPKAAWPRLAIAFNADQVDSKLWLIEELSRTVDLAGHRVVILGAWFGVLALMMSEVMPRAPAAFVCIDIDPAVCALATRMLAVVSPPTEVRCADMLEVDYRQLSAGRPTIFVNTSCEHLADFAGWRKRVPAGAALVIQSNDHWGCPEHVNCVPDAEAFARQAHLSHTDFCGTLRLARFSRFMLIGRT